MLIGAFISFGMLVIAWLAMPVKSLEAEVDGFESTSCC